VVWLYVDHLSKRKAARGAAFFRFKLPYTRRLDDRRLSQMCNREATGDGRLSYIIHLPKLCLMLFERQVSASVKPVFIPNR